jgi:hypothetical protein
VHEYDPEGKVKFLKLLKLKLGQEITYDDFREEVLRIYNFKLDHRAVAPEELDAIERLFNVVAYYSPFPHDRAEYPSVFRDEADVERAVNQARIDLGVE